MHREPISRRRTKVARTKVERGIRKRMTSDGVRYEVVYRDANGTQRSRTVDRLQDARMLRGDLVAKVARGEAVTQPKTTFAELAETWHQARSVRVRPRTSRYYRDALDLVLLPRFSRHRLAASTRTPSRNSRATLNERDSTHSIRPARFAPLAVRASRTTSKPLQAVLALAVRRKLISANPFDVLTDDDRPKPDEPQQPHEWTSEEVVALVAASKSLATKGVAKYDYSLLLRVVATLGLRKGEALGLTWAEFDRDTGHLHVRRQWTQAGAYGPTKTPAGVRRIALPADLRDELIALRLQSAFSLDDQPVFASVAETPLGHRNVSPQRVRTSTRSRRAPIPSHLP